MAQVYKPPSRSNLATTLPSLSTTLAWVFSTMQTIDTGHQQAFLVLCLHAQLDLAPVCDSLAVPNHNLPVVLRPR